MEGTQWAVFEPNDERLWTQLRISAANFLTRTWREGALFGSTPEQAFFVKCDEETNPPDVVEAGQVVDRDRHRAGEAGRVRRLPHQPVHGRRRRDHRVIRASREEDTMPIKEPRPASHFRLTLGGHESRRRLQGGVGLRLRDRGRRAQGRRPERPPVHPQGRRWRSSGRTSRSSGVSTRASTSGSGATPLIKEGADKARVDGKIELLDITGSPIATYQFKQGWPIKYVAATLDASTNNVALEELQICHEGFERVLGRERRPAGEDRVRIHAAPRATSTTRGRCIARARCGSPLRGTRSSRFATPDGAPERGVPVRPPPLARRHEDRDGHRRDAGP